MLPREIETERGPEKSRFDLPVRNIGPLRFIGLVPMVFGVGFAWMPAGQMIRMLKQISAGNGSIFEWAVVAFLSVFVIAAMMPFGFGLFMLAGRTRIIVGKDRLVMTELAGPIRWSRKVKLEDVERLEIGGATTADGRTPGFLGALCGVTAILKNGRKTPVAVGYPREWLQPLVDEISSLMQRHGKVVPVAEATLTPRGESQSETEQRVEKPAGSTIEMSTSDRGMEFQVPSRGLWKDSYGLIGFGIFWCLITGAVTAGGVFGKGFAGNKLEAAGFFALFWAVGIGLLLLGIHLGTRRWTLRSDHSELHVTLKSALRSREWHWVAGEIENVSVGNSSTEVNHRPLEQLQVQARTGTKKTGLLTGRPHEELAWVATTLRETLGVQISNPTDAPPRIDPSRRRS